MNRYQSKQKGFALAEMIIVIFIVSLIGLALGRFGRDIFWHNFVISRSLVADSDAKLALARLISELRRAQPASNGAYPIAVAEADDLVFYSDLDNDGLRERLRYWLDGSTLKRGLIEPVGPPYVYNQNAESVSSVIDDLTNVDNLIFTYYNNSYDGTASSTPLQAPFDIQEIRLVKVEFLVDANVEQAPVALYLTSQVMLRNLKDNL
ncbi:MAG: hypothetical protein COV08_00605 [Candidatus Vogelbacteria bacterium CG10_big_fil_rev_8_21_14_0_10_49_38]|uniref:Type II secretion system protein J n=1 Tax=Candidatus Vogelbacteria bacterium CG10_big_fil_rev_8_21_14_0_10_49_38 TaxID=1975043 RepID=A0A2H0RIQ0_9BACT|nr:MAG: hypothetical protein BK006_00610 [bacterium CG10_49_38]PIR46419.1 MAG: hypothetical protein COV08_00605 [Candidatus Vogelbacteria bacterium CG10_big_fil_rev_8_21_14_0_10_49_38]